MSARALFQCQLKPFSSLSPFPLALFPLTLTFCSRHHLMMIWMRKDGDDDDADDSNADDSNGDDHEADDSNAVSGDD